MSENIDEEIKKVFFTESKESKFSEENSEEESIYHIKQKKNKKEKTSKKIKKARCFLITLFNIDYFEEIKKYLISLKSLNYIIAGEEIGHKSKKKHIHIYCQFEVPIKLSVKKLYTAHIDICLGTPEANVKYVSKEGNIIFEYGTLRGQIPKTIKQIKEAKKEDLLELHANYYNIVQKELMRRGDIIDINTFSKFENHEVFYIWGESGVGKTNMAIKIMQEKGITKFNLVCYINGFWNGVTEDCDTALYDDFRDNVPAHEFIKFIDYNTQLLNIKGGHIKNKYKIILITTIQNPKYLYQGMLEQNEQWLRRMKIFNLIKR